jgi:hypothetical protein
MRKLFISSYESDIYFGVDKNQLLELGKEVLMEVISVNKMKQLTSVLPYAKFSFYNSSHSQKFHE